MLMHNPRYPRNGSSPELTVAVIQPQPVPIHYFNNCRSVLRQHPRHFTRTCQGCYPADSWRILLHTSYS